MRDLEEMLTEDDGMPTMGHNTENASKLRNIVSRIEKLEDERRDIAELIRDVYKEGKSAGFDAKIIRELVKQRRQPEDVRKAFDDALDVYKHAMGMV